MRPDRGHPSRPASTAAAVVVAALAVIAVGAPHAVAQPASSQAVRLYVLDGGTLIYNNPESYNLTRQEVKNTNMAAACYLVVHPRGALMFDTGLGDQFVGRPFNETPLGGRPDPPSTAYFVQVTQTVKSQLAAIGLPAERIDFLALSHPHGDHVGNANAFANSTWLVRKGDYDVMFGPGVSTPNPMYSALKTSKLRMIEGEHDVFGDGTVVLKHTPGHTPGHQSLYVKLANTGGVVLSGDLYHYPEERTLNRMPEREKTTETPASRAAIERFMQDVGAQLWIEHDIALFSRQRKAPQFYD
jgi:glyoxylase-like metal-dependent hydrolase (beta-lactamase superfamily II)